jgi:hypothetical protein
MRVGGSRPKTSSFRRLDCLFLKHIPSSEKRFIAFCQTSKECRLKILYICLQWVDDVALNVVGYISVSGNPENFLGRRHTNARWNTDWFGLLRDAFIFFHLVCSLEGDQLPFILICRFSRVLIVNYQFVLDLSDQCV